jgi:hypothetical protein
VLSRRRVVGVGWEVRLGRRMRIIGISGNLDGARDRRRPAWEEFEGDMYMMSEYICWVE